MTSRIEQLMKLCMQENASEAERKELLGLLQAAENEGETKNLIRQALEGTAKEWEDAASPVSGAGDPTVTPAEQDGLDISEEVSAAVLEAIFQADAGKEEEAEPGKVRMLFPRRRWVAYAAAALLAIVSGVLFFKQNKTAPKPITLPKQDIVKEIPPGGNKATLTLADGATISLDDAKKGDIARDGNAEIVKAGSGGTLVYHAMAGKQEAIAYNTITTPRGGQYQLDLSDGSKVWLNASSSLRFPTTFNGKDRTVELTGEGYFEIARNTAMPFAITVNGVRVQVLGTRFNINAYHDEPAIRTTLIEGAVRVVAAEQAMLLKPGQQAVASRGDAGSLKLDPDADLEEVMAWKNEIFNFKNLDIETIMRQISRWYDVEVVYEGKKPEGHFTGMISRNTPALTVLKMLEYGGVHFTIASKKIVIGQK